MPKEQNDEEDKVTYAQFPVDRMQAVVLVRDPQSLREIHVLALRHIVADGTITGLLNAFGLGERIMQEVLADLVFNDVVGLNLSDDQVYVNEPYKGMLISGDIERVKIALYRTEEIKVTWIQDRISHEIFCERGLEGYLRPPTKIVQPLAPKVPPGTLVPLRETANSVLARAAIPDIEERTGRIDLTPAYIEQIEKKRMIKGDILYIPVKKIPDPETGEEYWIPLARGIPGHVIDVWSRLLNGGEAALPPLRRDDFDLAALSPREIAHLLHQRLDAAAELGTANLSSARTETQWEAVNSDLKKLFHTADRLDRSVGNHKLQIGNRVAQHEFLSEVADRAKERIVIGSAFFSTSGVEELLDLLRPTLQRGVRVFLLGGIPSKNINVSKKAIDNVIGSHIRLLDDEYGSAVSFEVGRLPFHSKFILIDGLSGMVSSHNWMSTGQEPSPVEASLLTDAPEPVRELIAYAEHLTPPGSPWENEYGPMYRENRKRDSRQLHIKRAYESIRSSWQAFFGSNTPELHRKPFQDAVNAARSQVEALSKIRPILIASDDINRRCLFKAFATARGSVLVTSDQVSPSAAGKVLAGSIASASERGINVHMRWGRQDRMKNRLEEWKASYHAVTKLLQNVPEESRSAIDIPDTPEKIHAKLVAKDDEWLVVSSYNFLSFGSAVRDDQPLTKELGWIVIDQDIVLQAWNHLRVKPKKLDASSIKKTVTVCGISSSQFNGEGFHAYIFSESGEGRSACGSYGISLSESEEYSVSEVDCARCRRLALDTITENWTQFNVEGLSKVDPDGPPFRVRKGHLVSLAEETDKPGLQLKITKRGGRWDTAPWSHDYMDQFNWNR